MSFRPRLAFVVSHTHWDREWYRTASEYRVQLSEVVGEILDRLEQEPEFRHFLLDGQSALLLDYIEDHPEDEERIRGHVRSGGLSLGPCFVLPDSFLVSGEAHVRNLLHGRAVALRFGGVQDVGYTPDSFGHCAQMPQLLAQAGMDSFVFTRGSGDEFERCKNEFVWRAPDGSEVLALHQTEGYCHGGGLGLDDPWLADTQRKVDPARAVQQVAAIFDKMEPESRGDVVLLNNGCDHFPPQRDWSRVWRALQRAFPETEFRHTSLRPYVDEVRQSGMASEVHEGELRGGKLQQILSGVWSSRMELKQQNDAAQRCLEKLFEPFAAYSRILHGYRYPRGRLTRYWRTLLLNHPHDSICGCSIDAVHEEMGPRFAIVERGSRHSIRRVMQKLVPSRGSDSEHDTRKGLCVANTLPRPRCAQIERWLQLGPQDVTTEKLGLVDEEGEAVPFEVLEEHVVERFWGVDYTQALELAEQEELLEELRQGFALRYVRKPDERGEHDRLVRVRLAVELPALGHRLLRVTKGGVRAEIPETLQASDGHLENDFVHVEIRADASVILTDKRSGEVYGPLHHFSDQGDRGDVYDFSPCEEHDPIHSHGIKGKRLLLERSRLAARVEVRLDLLLPEHVQAERSRRGLDFVRCPMRVVFTLRHDSPLLDIETEFQNGARDHRLQVLFDGIAHSDRLESDSVFQIVSRPILSAAELQRGREDWVQPAPATSPQHGYSFVHSGVRGLAVLALGLPEVEARRGTKGGSGLALTLLRSTGWMSRDDFASRNHKNAGPSLPTPGAQCLGRYVFRYALVPLGEHPLDSIEATVGEGLGGSEGLDELSQRWRVPALSTQGCAEGAAASGCGLLELRGAGIRASAIKLHEERETLIVRLVNLHAEERKAELRLGFDAEALHETDLLEERREEHALGDRRHVEVSIPACRILTLEITPRLGRDDGVGA